jgi:hypothetical protein
MKECRMMSEDILADMLKINEFEFEIDRCLGTWMEGQSEEDRKVVDIT